jgi:hypothetical protein
MHATNRRNACGRGGLFRCNRSFAATLVLAAGLAAPALGAETGKCGPANPFRDALVCVQEYALCISAPCVNIPPKPGDGGVPHAACVCEVVHGASIGKGSCESRKPVTTGGGTHLISTYSFQQNLPQYKLLTCTPAAGKSLAYADCYNQPCVVDPHDPAKATCTCPVLNTQGGSYISRGGNCDTSCTQLLSGAPAKADEDVNWQFACDLGMPTPPDPHRCPGQ